MRRGGCGSRWADRFGGTGTIMACSRHVGVLALDIWFSVNRAAFMVATDRMADGRYWVSARGRVGFYRELVVRQQLAVNLQIV